MVTLIPRTINFIDPAYTNAYSRIIDSITVPVISYLNEANWIKSKLPKEDCINVHFSSEKNYQEQMNVDLGISVNVGHGLADKRLRKGDWLERFHYIFVSGPLWFNKLFHEGVPEHKLIITGYPKLDPVFASQVRKKTGKRNKVLYAPTHFNSLPSSYPAFMGYLSLFPSDFNVIAAPHPFNKQDCKPTIDELADTDVIITDCGSLIYEAWALSIPVIFPDWLVKESVLSHWPDSITAQIYREQIGLHASDFKHLVQLTYDALTGGIDELSRQWGDEILPSSLRGCSAKVMARELIKLTKGC